MTFFSKKLYLSDLLGASVSVACAIHCAITPLFFLSKPILDSTIHVEHSHGSGLWGALDWVFLALSLVAVWYTSNHTTLRFIRFLLWFFWLAFAFGIILELQGLGHLQWLIYLGSLSLTALHLVNFQYCKSQDHKIKTQS